MLGATGRRREPAGRVFGDEIARQVAHTAAARTMFVQPPAAA